MSIHSREVLNALREAMDAQDQVPQLQARIYELERKLSGAEVHAQNLELKAIDYHEQIESLSAKVRSLEVERDDASFRELEAREEISHLKADADKASDLFNQALSLINPPKPVVVVEPEPVAQVVSVPNWHNTGTPTVTEAVQSVEPTPEQPVDTDPEPQPKWSVAWYEWNDRRNAKQAQSRAY